VEAHSWPTAGDCLKLRAVYRKELAHLVDCVVFAGKGLRAAPSMTSGGDLDGDKFLICWDPDIVPTRLMRVGLVPRTSGSLLTVDQSYDYPPNKEHTSAKVTRQDLARHFASYNTCAPAALLQSLADSSRTCRSGLARVAALHQKWAWNAPEGALCTQCLELNALHSQSVDGARVVVPERLLSPPVSAEPYIIDLLVQEAEAFAQRFQEARAAAPEDVPADTDADAEARVVHILSMERSGISEYEAFLAAARIARTHGIDLRRHLALLDFGALTAAQKHAVSFALGTRPDEDRHIWNSLFRSNILTARDLRERNLDRPLRLQRLYTSREAGTAAFFEYLHMAASNYVRKLIILKVVCHACRRGPQLTPLADGRALRRRRVHPRRAAVGRGAGGRGQRRGVLVHEARRRRAVHLPDVHARLPPALRRRHLPAVQQAPRGHVHLPQPPAAALRRVRVREHRAPEDQYARAEGPHCWLGGAWVAY
jgi:hypothetical protein